MSSCDLTFPNACRQCYKLKNIESLRVKMLFAVLEQSSRFHWLADWGDACSIVCLFQTAFQSKGVLGNIKRDLYRNFRMPYCCDGQKDQ